MVLLPEPEGPTCTKGKRIYLEMPKCPWLLGKDKLRWTKKIVTAHPCQPLCPHSIPQLSPGPGSAQASQRRRCPAGFPF